MYSLTIGGNYFECLPKHKKSYGPAGVQRVRSERYQRASRQQQENAKTSTGHPDLSTLTLADQEIHGMFSEALVSRRDSATILELAKDVLKRLSKEMHQALHFRGSSSQMKQLMEWADGGSSDYPRPGQQIPVLYHKRQITRK